jgi:uncharacterized protein YdeI (YjbR/CyaY-like superfamily)
METIPLDLKKVLGTSKATKAAWDSLTPIGRRDFLTWISSAKQEETRKRRVERVPSMLATGKRRPCCFAVVPMGLYKALDKHVKAKVFWKTLTPDERRDFTDWIGAGKDAAEREKRIEKSCTLLASKRHRS